MDAGKLVHKVLVCKNLLVSEKKTKINGDTRKSSKFKNALTSPANKDPVVFNVFSSTPQRINWFPV